MKPYLQFFGAPDAGADPRAYQVYPDSVNRLPGGGAVYMADDGEQDVLVAFGAPEFEGETGVAFGLPYTVARLDHGTAQRLRARFPFTAPTNVLTRNFTMGVGDRLGIATPGHLRVFKDKDVHPILAQQSIRELTLTGRTFEDVLDAATFGVFREGYREGFGADGDHLKKPEEVRCALDCGYTMITLDCSEHILGGVDEMTDAEVDARYEPDPVQELLYVGKTFYVGDMPLTYTRDEMKRICLIYGKAIDFAVSIYEQFFKENDGIDFEISIDETATPTTPLQHFFIANELTRRGVKFATMAPRFCGEFQKGVDYIGDLAQFEREYVAHTQIANQFGYKISVHSGSDKFSVFPVVGRVSGLHVHVKTAGTNWLEAMRVVAMKDPALYRAVHKFALSMFPEAKKFYHVTTNLANIPDVDTLDDGALEGLFEQNDARQLIHITYGFILTHRNADGSFAFRDSLYRLWRQEAEAYAERLHRHIGRHVAALESEV